MRILIAEDHASSRELLQSQLEAEGHSVLAAADGCDALAILQRENVDAIISDILMPRMDGYRFCYEVRKDERWRHLPLIFYTSTYTSPSDEKLALELTADHFIRKPASSGVILDALHRVVGQGRRAISQPAMQLGDLGLIKEYSERLVSKLEEKNAELARANQELRASEARLLLQATALETAANAITITDATGAMRWVNPAFTTLTGYTAEEAIGQTPRLLKSGQHDQMFYRSFWKTLLSGQTWRGEFINRRKDGGIFYAEHTVTPVRSQNGAITHFIGIMNDVTERKRLEAQFVQAQKMEVVGQLAGGVAHDFNNILAVIMGYSDLMLQEFSPDHPMADLVDQIRYAADRATALTRQLLVFSRKQTLQPVVLDLNEVVAGLEKMLRRLIDESIELTFTPGNEIGRVRADFGYLGQVLMNLVVNARDAMPDGGKLTIETSNVTLDENHARAHAGAAPGRHVMFAVRDTGVGMTDEVKAQLFEAFFTTKPKGKGTGLGLATCRTIVKQCGGHIEVSSQPGQGATFKVYLPRVDLALESDTQFVKAGPLPRGTETLMVVEDEPALRHLAASVLEAKGYTVLRANSGQDGLRVAREHQGPPIRLVITDVIMPQMSGKVMAEWLKATYPGLQVLFTSGYTDDALATRGVLDPGVAFLAKPYTPATLLRKMRQMLDAPQEAHA